MARRAPFDLTRAGVPVASLTPEKRFYPVEQEATSEARIHMGPLRDLYVVLGEPVEGEAAGAGQPCASIRIPWSCGSWAV